MFNVYSTLLVQNGQTKSSIGQVLIFTCPMKGAPRRQISNRGSMSANVLVDNPDESVRLRFLSRSIESARAWKSRKLGESEQEGQTQSSFVRIDCLNRASRMLSQRRRQTLTPRQRIVVSCLRGGPAVSCSAPASARMLLPVTRQANELVHQIRLSTTSAFVLRMASETLQMLNIGNPIAIYRDLMFRLIDYCPTLLP